MDDIVHLCGASAFRIRLRPALFLYQTAITPRANRPLASRWIIRPQLGLAATS